MARNYVLKEVEEEHGNLNEVIPELLEQMGTQKAVADHLGISQFTVSKWLADNGYRKIVRYVKEKGEHLN